MTLIEIFENELGKNEEATVENIIHALNIVSVEIKTQKHDCTDILTFGKYFFDNYDELTKDKRLKNGIEPECILIYFIVKSLCTDREYWNTYGCALSKKEMYEVDSFKKELQKLFHKYHTFAIGKETYTDTALLKNFIYIKPDIDIMCDSVVDLFLKNAILADQGQIIVFVPTTNNIIYTLNHGHWTSKEGRKF